MAFTNDNTFQGKIRPFSEEFATKMQGIAADVARLNALLPVINYTLQMVDPSGEGGEGGGPGVFPARIVAGEAGVYDVWYETTSPFSAAQKVNGKNSVTEGSAFNSLEITVDGGAIPPGLDCLDDFGALNVRPIRGVVMMSAYAVAPSEDDKSDPVTFYWFSCPPSICPDCTTGNLAVQEKRYGAESFAGSDPEFERITGQTVYMDHLKNKDGEAGT